MGELAEQWTAGELRKARRDGWRLVNHVHFPGAEVDHVLLGPGGLICLETKWSASQWSSQRNTDRVRQAAHSLQKSIRKVRLLTHQDSSRQIVVLWGGQAGDNAGPDGVIHYLGDVTVVWGGALRRWLRTLPSGPQPPMDIDTTFELIATYVERHEPHDETFYDIPDSLERQLLRIMARVALGLTSAFVPPLVAVDYLCSPSWS